MEDDNDDVKTLISFQREELMAAKLCDSDLDFAYNLQMQEAIAASQLLSPQPPTATTTLPSLAVVKEEGSSSSEEHFSDAILREIEKYEQELRDFEQCKLEMKNVKRNLSIQLHDQKFASEIAHIPDHEWQNNGDNVEKPYNSCFTSSSSSSSNEVNLGIECFRMYFKGILDGDGRNKVAAIGVAICDPRDNLIFEVSKPVVDVKESELSEERVEFEALIAGLDAAMVLELRRVEYFCDDFMFYQAVSGWHQPTERSIENIIDRMNVLQKQFIQCTPELIARSDVKFAFRLARASLSSQLSKLAGNDLKDLKETCSICFEDRVSKLMFSVDGCGHRYCSLCVEQHLEAKLLNGTMPKCPSEGCNSGITIEKCQKLLSPKLLDIMSQRMKEGTIPASEKVYCPNPKCSMLMSLSEVNDYTRNTFVRHQENGSSRCIKCHGLFCVDCKVPWHHSTSCRTFQQNMQSNSNNSDTKLKSLATEKRWRQCRQCANVIELAEGCYHITCRCGYEFCYICGAAWKNKKQTCKCRLWDEPNIIHGRNVRQR